MIRESKNTTEEFVLDDVVNEVGNHIVVKRCAKIYFINGVLDHVVFECKGGKRADHDDRVFRKLVAAKIESIKKTIVA